MISDVNLIGLSGKRGRGKDTVFTILQGLLAPDRVKRDAFADRLKISFARMFLMPGDQTQPPDYEGWTDQECIDFCNAFKERGEIIVPEFEGEYDGAPITWAIEPTSGREALQKYGTEMHRDVFGESFWTDAVLPNPRDYQYGYGRKDYADWDLLVITDARFPNEAERIKQCGGVIWEVIRPELDQDEANNDDHASEQPLPRELVDHTIVNLEGLDNLKNEVIKAWTLVNAEPTYGAI